MYFDQYLVVYTCSAFQYSSQPERLWAQALAALLCVFQSAWHHWPPTRSVTDRSDSSPYSKYCGILQAGHPSRTLQSSRLVNLLKFVDVPIQVSNISVFVVALFPSQNVYYFPSYILPSVAAATRPFHLTYVFFNV
jgi:hypothetical protein